MTTQHNTKRNTMSGFIPNHAILIEYKIYLSAGRYAFFTIPEDLSTAEGQRLGRIIATTAGAWEQSPVSKQVIAKSDDVPVFRGTCTCEHPEYDHAMYSCDPDC